MKLEKVLQKGYQYFHKFKANNGSFFEVGTTQEDYQQLGSKNPNNPTNPNGTWNCSYECLKFDTPSGFLEDGKYAIVDKKGVPGQYKVIKIPLLPMISVELGELPANEEITVELQKKSEATKEFLNNNKIPWR